MQLGEIYADFRKSLLAFIRGRVSSGEDAEDILQDVFFKISSSLEKLSDDQKLNSWVYSITRNSIIDYYRAGAKRSKISTWVVSEEILSGQPTPDTTKGLDLCMTSLISLLPKNYREILIDAEINGVSQKDLAHKYEMAYPSMRSRVQRGRTKLKQLFRNCCHIESDHYGHIIEVQQKTGCGDECTSCGDDKVKKDI
jgi:RNA polymerase sigma-70 factor, ECF subfamily